MLRGIVFFFVLARVGGFVFASDVPAGLLRNAESQKPENVELLVSPILLISPGGAFLASELRYQANEDFGTGFHFGAGETGFNLGLSGTWYLFPDTAKQPAVAIFGAMYFNRAQPHDYFVVKLVPTISKRVVTSWGSITPYGGIHLTPTFRLNLPENLFAVRTSSGAEFALKALGESRLWVEAGVNIVNSVHALIMGFSYPLTVK